MAGKDRRARAGVRDVPVGASRTLGMFFSLSLLCLHIYLPLDYMFRTKNHDEWPPLPTPHSNTQQQQHQAAASQPPPTAGLYNECKKGPRDNDDDVSWAIGTFFFLSCSFIFLIIFFIIEKATSLPPQIRG